MTPEQRPALEIPADILRDWENLRGRMEGLGIPVSVLLEAALTPDPEKIPLTDKPGDSLFFDSISGDVIHGGQTIFRLSNLQREVFGCLVLARGRTVTYGGLISLWPEAKFFSNEELREANVLRTHAVVRKIRKKFREVDLPELAERLENRRGIGYRWNSREKEEQGCFEDSP